MTPGHATAEGTARFRRRFADRVAAGHFRRAGELSLSSIGLGTYLGEPDDATDAGYEEAIAEALGAGVNVFDTAASYRRQRSEKALGRALESAFAAGLANRDEVFVSTKGGFLTEGGSSVAGRELERGLLEVEDVAAGCHALAPAFLADQLSSSCANLGLETIDLFYLHNPETQLEERSESDGLERIDRAIAWTAAEKASGRIALAGLATWNGLRVPPGSGGHLPLTRLLGGPAEAGGLWAIQLPVNLAMPEALAAPTQELEGVVLPALVVARHSGLQVFASASILQGRLAAGLPAEIEAVFGDLETDAQRALQFTRSTPGVTTALVGMSSVEHVRENLVLARHETAGPEDLQRLFAGGVE